MRVLYVDDDRINTVLFVAACRLAGEIEVENVGSGAEAIELIRRWRPDLLVIDLHLPDTTGYALLPALRKQLGTPALPAVLCTADELDQVEPAARAAGFGDCWIKPVSPPRVAAELSKRRAESAPG